jgi:hypothetical protein
MADQAHDEKQSRPDSVPYSHTQQTMSRNLFLAASLISAISIPVHILATINLGINIRSPHLPTALDGPGVFRPRGVERATRVAFNYVNVGLFISGEYNPLFRLDVKLNCDR